MPADEYKNYILGFMFYKFLSDNYKKEVKAFCEENEVSEEDCLKDLACIEFMKEGIVKEIGYFLKPGEDLESVLDLGNSGENVSDKLSDIFTKIESRTKHTDSQEDFEGLFSDLDLYSNKLGEDVKTRERRILKLLQAMKELNYNLENQDIDILGDAYEYLIANFAATAGKKGGEFYTPQAVSKILSKIISIRKDGKTALSSVYDPTCGSGSLLLQVRKNIEVKDLYGQELNPTTYNLARMNMLMHNVSYKDFTINRGDTLKNPKHLGLTFDGIVANPPYSLNWEPEDDQRFANMGGYAPKGKADFAFVQHCLGQLKEDGIFTVVLPHGVLFRGAAEGKIRKFLIDEKNYLDAVIGLPANIFFGTSIPTVVLVFKKNREEEDGVLFMDASSDFEKSKNQNILRDQDIDKLIAAYKNRKDIEKYSRLVPLSEIAENDFNLNIPRYVDTFEAEDEIILADVFADLAKVESEGEALDSELAVYFKELGV
jgi:type I restriction enzyme M protein